MRTIFIAISLLFTSALIGQELMSIGEVFNFEINDEFHYRNQDESSPVNPPNVTRHRVIDKQFSENNDTVFYTLYNFSYSTTINSDMNLTYNFSSDTIERFYTNLDAPISEYDHTFAYDTIIETFTCGRTVNGYTYSEGDFEPLTITKKYGMGLGKIYTFEQSGLQVIAFSQTLIYYKKGNNECGTPDLYTGLESMTQQPIEIYPNPVINTFEIKNNNESLFAITVYDLTGRQVISLYNQNIIDISNFNKGTYIVEIKTEKSTITKKIMKL